MSDPSSSGDSDSSDNSDYRRKRRKRKSDQKNDPIKLCARLTEKLLTTAYKSKITRFKIDEDPLQRRIYFLIFIESLEIILLQYTGTCEVLVDYPKIEGENIKIFAKKSIRNLLRANIDVHSRRLISDFPVDGINVLKNYSPIVLT